MHDYPMEYTQRGWKLYNAKNIRYWNLVLDSFRLMHVMYEFSDTHRQVITGAIRYTARIATAGTGNSFLIGPIAFEKGFSVNNPEALLADPC